MNNETFEALIKDLDRMIKIKTNISFSKYLQVGVLNVRPELDGEFYLIKVHVHRYDPSIDHKTYKTDQITMSIAMYGKDVIVKGQNQSETNEKLKNDFNDKLRRTNFMHQNIGQYTLISETTPDFDEAYKMKEKVLQDISKGINLQMMPLIGDQLSMQDIYATYGVLMSDPQVDLKKEYDTSDKVSTLSLRAELISRTLEVDKTFRVQLELEDAVDYSDIYWLYEDLPEFDFIGGKAGMMDYTEDIVELIDHSVRAGVTSLKYDDVTLNLLEYNGLSLRDSFIIDQDTDHIQYNTTSLNRLFDEGVLDGLVQDIKSINPENTAFLVTFMNGKSIYAGNNGMTSPEGIIYKRGDEEHGSLKKAKTAIEKLVGPNPAIPTLLSAYDKRKNRSPLAGKKFSTGNLFE